jgi:thiol-disulfide isomerase/thioredoxin
LVTVASHDLTRPAIWGSAVTYLYIAAGFLALLGTFNLVLTLGVVRRLRELESRPAGRAAPAGTFVIGPGATVTRREVTDTAARSARLPDPGAATLVGFFATDCPSCADSLPEFLARATADGRHRTLAVVTGARDDDHRYVDQLAPTVPVVADPEADDLVSAFRVRVFPAFVLLGPDGIVRASGNSLDDVPAPRLTSEASRAR